MQNNFLRETPEAQKRTSTLKYYFRLEKRSGYPARNRQQFPLSGKYPDYGSFAEFRQVDRAAMANSGGTFRRCNHGGKFRQHQPGMEKKLVERICRLGLLQLFQAVRFVNREFADRRTFEYGKVPARP